MQKFPKIVKLVEALDWNPKLFFASNEPHTKLIRSVYPPAHPGTDPPQ